MDVLSSISSSKTLPNFENSIGVYGDASFSSYLNPKDDNFVRKLTDSTPYLNNPNIIPGKGSEDGEIGVFGAEKYFNGGMEDEGSQKSTNPRKSSQKLDKQVLAHAHHHMDEPFKPKPWLATPSVVGSESSSINSQKALLTINGNITTTTTTTATTIVTNSNSNSNKNNNSNSKSFLSTTLGYCICYSCNGETAVDVKDDVGEISFSNGVTAKPIRNNGKLEEETPSFGENPFSFPTGSLKLVHFQEEEVERKSLEVFGSPMMGRLRNKPIVSLEKRLAMLSWDHTTNNNDDEVNSDCSSDLFEIESLTKQPNSFQSPTTSCYAPSEASVEWSVVTASALDFDERRPSTTSPARVPPPPPPRRVNVNKEVVVVHKRRSSSLLGCKSEKAVTVAEDNSNGRKISAKPNSNSSSDHRLMERLKLESSVPVPVSVKRFEDETKVGGVSFRSQVPPLQPPPHRTLATRALPRPYSPRLSNINFNIQ